MTNTHLNIDLYEVSKELEKQADQITIINKTILCEVSEAVPYRPDLIESIDALTTANDDCILYIDQIRKDLKTVGLSNDFE